MMAKFYMYMKPKVRIHNYIEERLSEIKDSIEKLEAERVSLEWLSAQIGVCKTCDGDGTVRVQKGMDFENEKCPDCKGYNQEL